MRGDGLYMYLRYFVILLTTVMLLTACSFVEKTSNGEQQFSGNDAIAKVVHEKRNGFSLVHARIKGTIYGGGPAPGITIPGEFESSATKKKKDVFIVTLTEYWKAEDFRDSAEKEGTLSAYWKYEVTPTEIKFLEQGGDTSPELIE
jgi:uncharacterized protein YceK